VKAPLLVGPDAESEQWVRAVAADAGAPYRVLTKVRRGDTDVDVSLPDIAGVAERTPVLVDDIISTGATMAAAVRHLRRQGLPPPICLGVHAVFATGSYDALRAAGAAQIVTTNTIAHETNAIDVLPLLVPSVMAG
jgi:ribose-phosphate pyrophosphokinase